MADQCSAQPLPGNTLTATTGFFAMVAYLEMQRLSNNVYILHGHSNCRSSTKIVRVFYFQPTEEQVSRIFNFEFDQDKLLRVLQFSR